MRSTVAYLIRGEPGATAYARGSFGRRDPEYGLSDLDLAVVLVDDRQSPGAGRLRVRRRWERLCGMFPPARSEVDLAIYEEADLAQVAAASTLTADGVLHFGPNRLVDEAKLSHRPGLDQPLADWRPLRGPERHLPARSSHEERLSAWLELQFWWRAAISACAGPQGVSAAYTSVKLLAEVARIWLWVARRERAPDRRETLLLALRRLPEEEDAFRLALELQRALDRGLEPRLGEALPAFVRLSGRVARELFDPLEDVESVRVCVRWGGHTELALPAEAQDGLHELLDAEPELFPLADWRAIVVPPSPDETFALVPFGEAQPEAIAAAAAAARTGCSAVLHGSDLLIRPVRGGGGLLRSVQCSTTDPVSFALLAGAEHADFTTAPGLAAADWARRATAEHRAWLQMTSDPAAPTLKALGRQFTAARAALFLSSIEEGEPQLALTVAATAVALSNIASASRTVVEEAACVYSLCRLEGRDPPETLVAGLRQIVLGLPAYTREAGRRVVSTPVQA